MMFVCEEHRDKFGRDTGCPYCRERKLCEHDFFTVQSEDSRCMNCGETESGLRIAELEAQVERLKVERDDWEGRLRAVFDGSELANIKSLAQAVVGRR